MIGVNLIPADVVLRHATQRRLRVWAVVSLLLGATTAVPIVLERRQQAQIQRLDARVTEADVALRAVRAQTASTAQAVLDLDAELARAAALRTKRSWAGLLTLLSAQLPPQVWLTTLATDPPQPGAGRGPGAPAERPPAGTPAGGNRPAASAVTVLEAATAVRLDGYAVNHEGLYDLMSRLKESGAFTEVNLVSAGMEPILQGRAVHFVLTCGW
jgi:Tfp pilus assembly protein PilN